MIIVVFLIGAPHPMMSFATASETVFNESKAQKLADSVRLNARNNPKLALEASQIALDSFASVSFPEFEAVVLNESSYALYFLARYPEAMQRAKRAEDFARKHQLKNAIARSQILQGNVLQQIGENQGALKLYRKALNHYQKSRQAQQAGRVLNNIGNVYFNSMQYQSAIDFFHQYKALAASEHDQARASLGIANNLGELDKVEEAIKMYRLAFVGYKNTKDQLGQELALTGIGVQLTKNAQYDEAIEMFDSAIKSARKAQRQYAVINTLNSKARTLAAQSNLTKALSISDEALLLTELPADKINRVNVLKTKADILKKLKRFAEALSAYESAQKLEQEYINEQTANQLAVMQVQLEEDNKNHKIEMLSSENLLKELELSRQRITWIAVTISLIFIALIVFFLLRQFNQKRLLKEQATISKELKALDDLKTHMLVTMSHELRTPLNGIIGLSHLLLEDTPEKLLPHTKRNLRLLHDSGQRLLSLVEDVTDLSQIFAKRTHLNLTSVDLQAVFKRVCDFLQPIAKQKNLTLQAISSENLPRVEADEKRLYQVIYNLLDNAIKFSNKGTIHITAAQVKKGVEVRIIDEGIGISQADINRITQPFHQVDTSLARDNEGAGLGLAITRELLLLQGISLSLKSETGHGSEFSFILPNTIED